MLDIIIETKKWLILNKPAGIIVERNPFETVTVETLVHDYLSRQYRNPYVGIVHRLDKVTSGALIVAKRKNALKAFNELFRNKKIQKTYLAIVKNKPPDTEGELVHWLVKDQKNKKGIAHTSKVEGSFECRLSYELLEQLSSGFLLKIKPTTGKFHQIRVQLAAIDCPIWGDEKYGGISGYNHQTIALHAYTLQFDHPDTQITERIVADLPNNLFWEKVNTARLA